MWIILTMVTSRHSVRRGIISYAFGCCSSFQQRRQHAVAPKVKSKAEAIEWIKRCPIRMRERLIMTERRRRPFRRPFQHAQTGSGLGDQESPYAKRQENQDRHLSPAKVGDAMVGSDCLS